jgi:hypothetical protein
VRSGILPFLTLMHRKWIVSLRKMLECVSALPLFVSMYAYNALVATKLTFVTGLSANRTDMGSDIAACMRAKNILSHARRRRKLWPTAERMALAASLARPLR